MAEPSKPTLSPDVGGGVDALTLAVPLPHTVVGGHFRSTPWFGLDPKRVMPWYDFYVGMGGRPVTAKIELKQVLETVLST